jgi:hypothetical protein
MTFATIGAEPLRIMPFERNPRFTSREPELSRLEKLLSSAGRTTKIAITGWGAYIQTSNGAEEKTQVALMNIVYTNVHKLYQSSS